MDLAKSSRIEFSFSQASLVDGADTQTLPLNSVPYLRGNIADGQVNYFTVVDAAGTSAIPVPYEKEPAKQRKN